MRACRYRGEQQGNLRQTLDPARHPVHWQAAGRRGSRGDDPPWDNGYRKDNPVRGIKLKGVPAKPIIVATKDQFLRVYNALPHQPAKVLARLGVSSGARLCELISFIPEDFDFAADMLAVRRSTVEVTAKYHPTGDGFSRGSTPRTASTAGSKSIMRSRKWCRSTSRFMESGSAR